MLLNEILIQQHPIVIECSEFLELSEKLPLLKNLSTHYENFDKVKIRQRKKKDKVTQTFNEAFKQKTYHIGQRSLFANGSATFIAESGKIEPFFVFPINGFKFIYSPEVTNSQTDYQDAIDTVVEQFGDKEIIKDVLKYSYTSTNLSEGIRHGSEIVIYNIPYYYAIRSSTVDNYNSLIRLLEQ